MSTGARVERAPDPSPDEAERHFVEFLARHEAGEAGAFDALCREWPALAERLAELRAAWIACGSFFPSDSTDPDPILGEREREIVRRILEGLKRRTGAAGRWEPVEEFPGGSMGRVLRVRDLVLGRDLAVKLIRSQGPPVPGLQPAPLPGPTELRRFLDEARIMGRLDHPGIVPVHELGVDADGRAFFTMKLVAGTTLRDVLAEHHGGRGAWTRTRLVEVLLRVAEAVAYAHGRNVVHRDLKPSNVMVGELGQVYVMDWGLARDVDAAAERAGSAARDASVAASDPEAAELTAEGDVIGTPAYMSPEQAEGRRADVGAASDVYSLGAMLYHLLAGHPPHVRPGESTSGEEVRRRVREGPPERLRRVAPDAPAELAAIAERALSRSPTERYASMAELADDLRAWREGRVVRAHAGPLAAARKWIGRHKAAAAVAALLALVLAGATVALVLEQLRREKIGYFAGMVAAERLLDQGDVAAARAALDTAPTARRGWEWSFLESCLDSPSLRLVGHSGPVRAVEWLALDTWIVSGGEDRSVRLWSETGEPAAEPLSLPAGVARFAVHPRGTELAVACADGSLHRIELADWRARPVAARTRGQDQILSLSFDARGGALALARSDGSVAVVDWPEGALRDEWRPGSVFGVQFGARPEHLLTAHAKGDVVLWQLDTHSELWRRGLPGPAGAFALDLETGGARVAVGYETGRADLLDVSDGTPSWSVRRHRGPIITVRLDPSGQRLATAGLDGRIGLWSFARGDEEAHFVGHVGRVRALAFDRAGQRIVSAGDDGVVRAWEVGEQGPRGAVVSALPAMEYATAWSPDGSLLASGGRDNAVRLWDPSRLSCIAVGQRHTNPIAALAWSPDGGRLASQADDQQVIVWDAPKLREIDRILLDGDAAGVAFVSGDSLLALTRRSLRALSLATREERVLLELDESGKGACLALSPDRCGLALGTTSGQIRSIELPSGRERRSWSAHEGHGVTAIAFAPAGDRIVSTSEDGTVAIWRASDGRELGRLAAHAGGVDAASFHPDGTRLMTGGRDNVALVWDTADWQRLASLAGHAGGILSCAFSPDGRRAATSSRDGTIRFYSAGEAAEDRAARALRRSVEREARPHVAALSEQIRIPGDVAGCIAARADLAPRVRSAAMDLALAIPWDPIRLANQSFEAVLVRDAPAFEHARSLDMAWRSVHGNPDHLPGRIALGAALVRAGRAAEAVTVLDLDASRAPFDAGWARFAHLVFRALALRGVGRPLEADGCAAQALWIASEGRFAADSEVLGLLAEVGLEADARAAIAFPR